MTYMNFTVERSCRCKAAIASGEQSRTDAPEYTVGAYQEDRLRVQSARQYSKGMEAGCVTPGQVFDYQYKGPLDCHVSEEPDQTLDGTPLGLLRIIVD
jgi:hypothetical protein